MPFFQDLQYHFWWLVLWVNLTGLREAWRAGKMLFLGVSMRMVPAEIIAPESADSKEPPAQRIRASSHPLRVWLEERGGERAPSLCLSWGVYLLSLDVGTSGPWALRLRPGLLPPAPWFSGLWTDLWHTLPWISSLLVADGGLLGFRSLRERVPMISYSSVDLYLPCWFRFPGEPRLIRCSLMT